jgi:phage terminase large subunit-like protein
MLRKNSTAIPIPIINSKKLQNSERSELMDFYNFSLETERAWLKKQIIEFDRIDLLATEILGYEVKPFHLHMLRYQFLHPDSLQLAFRGSGKSTICTVTKAIHLLIKNRDLRIVLTSKTMTNSEGFLKEIKGHFEKNTKLSDTFGPFFDRNLVDKWDNKEIEILGKKKRTKECSITCVGVDGTIVSKHYDVALSDDMIDEDNSRTEYMRKKTQTFYYQTLLPTIEPPDPKVPHRGEHHRLGTRFHWDDLYGHLSANELKEHTNIIPALDEHGRSPWPEKYSTKWLADTRRKSGLIIFSAQYQCNTEAMKGKIFQYDSCQLIENSQIPDDLRKFGGVDLAIAENEENDNFVIVIVGTDTNNNYYLLDFYEGKIRFNEQTKKIEEFYDKYDPINTYVEANAYQKAQVHNLKYRNQEIRVKPKIQNKDKVSRAWKLSSIFDEKRFFVKKTGKSHIAIERLVLFPDGKGSKDFFDALDLAIKASVKKGRKERRREPGLL